MKHYSVFNLEISNAIFLVIIAYSFIIRWSESSRCQLLYQRPGTKRLTFGAEVGATVLHGDLLDGAAADGATESYEFRCS